MLFISLLFAVSMKGINSEIIRPMADMDIKVVSLRREVLEDQSTLVTLKYTAPMNSSITLDEQIYKYKSRIISTKSNEHVFTVKVKSEAGASLFHVNIYSKDKDVDLEVVIDARPFDIFENSFLNQDFKYQIDRSMKGELTNYSVKILRPVDVQYERILAGMFAVDLYTSDGLAISFSDDRKKYFYSPFPSKEGGDCYLNLSAIKSDGVRMENFRFFMLIISRVSTDILLTNFVSDI